ncbi:Uncharacterised protein [Enterococcus malodoratus]|uniref:Uncharacterized protein n=2 Tax=Enterococcus malodoratus TaxID=71451 RepID=R2R6I5_9ENTE|nr:hypothetical protein UAI_04545 [Enterococcus malodoratus ATCC 43197]EOT69721.1 hypothetical protein I585_01188 [Enterococcus malodoratus ATCC 43197]SPX01360.1 Uncharacterised protein [Enterococcus malodoratus]STC70926.1 Uncharacterised protein [Enterococcus malodoratus]
MMKKIYWLRRLTLLMAMIGVGAATTGFIPVWIKILLIAGVGGNLLLTEEFEFDLRSRASGR